MPQNKRELTIALILGSSMQGIDKQLPKQSHVLGGRALPAITSRHCAVQGIDIHIKCC